MSIVESFMVYCRAGNAILNPIENWRFTHEEGVVSFVAVRALGLPER